MARTKGALNKRTRMALEDAENGEFEAGGKATIKYLLAVVKDSKRDDGTRLRAADVLLPYLRPRLSAVEQTNITDSDLQSEEQINQAMAALIAQRPQLLDYLASIHTAASPEDHNVGKDVGNPEPNKQSVGKTDA